MIRWLTIILILIIIAAKEKEKNASFSNISPAEVKQLLDKSPDEVILLDVREPEEYASGHIPGAILISVRGLQERYGQIPKDKEIIVYCKSGCGRSPKACEMLARSGGLKVRNMTGGIDAWRESKGRVEGISQTREKIGKAVKYESGKGCES